ncbi:MAG: GNAT family N-acetyltransferase [Caulobacteraceae bacterium]
MSFRPAAKGDAAALAALHGACFEAGWSEAALERFIEEGFGFVAQDEPGPAGFILCRSLADEAEVLTLAVAPQRRRKGLGAGLIAIAGEEASKRGASRLFLEVAQHNLAGLALYAGCGFRIVGRRVGYYLGAAGASDALVLRLDL